MNPDTGRLHGEYTSGGAVATTRETVKEALERADRKAGPSLPEHWPKFVVGEEVGPVRGWWFKIESIDTEAQTMTIKPSRQKPIKTFRQNKRKRR
jgi:hypothetical protein